ncbi:hypothetical protein BJ322DRAFT_998121 [Thelephora terrestris]|uniref:Uncharacterized protein n=1 Tax=Thelephora terrestris TaxID=56493 RepID=A0A9P6HPQ8_9AGAM|nr:hypothetical protein BJ322DRAFT_998121 [Thelephora terrestris]
MSNELAIDDGHPLALELQSLRATVAKYQHEATSASVKLQRHSLDTSYTLERSQALERENSRLVEELSVLRAHPITSPDPSALQTPQLNNALRHLSDKLSQTEELLLKRTSETLHATHKLARVKYDRDAAFEIAAQARAREEDCKVRERSLLLQARNAKEESRMADLVVQEYASLVRNLTDRIPSSPQSSKSAEIKHSRQVSFSKDLAQGKIGLQKLISEFNQETENLHAEIHDLQSELELVKAQQESERKLAEQDRRELARVQTEFDKLSLDDSTAAKMVSRYMKFSQTSNDTLQNALESLKVRHAATTATLNSQIDYFQRCLFTEKRTVEKLRMALDDLTEDISRETYGRRRETSLRLACIGREENLAENLRRWHRKAREYHQRASSLSGVEEVLDVFGRVISESDGLLDALDGDVYLEDLPAGALARIIAARDAAGFLSQELQVETDRRMQLEKYLAHIQEQYPSLPTSTEQLSEIGGPPGHVADDSSSENLSTSAPPEHPEADTEPIIPGAKIHKPLPCSPTSPIPLKPSPNLVLYHPSPVATSPLDNVPWLAPELSGSDEAVEKEMTAEATSPTIPPPQVVVESTDPSIPSVHVSPVDPEPTPSLNGHHVPTMEEASTYVDDSNGPVAPPTLAPQRSASGICPSVPTARTPTPAIKSGDPKLQEMLEKLSGVKSRYDDLQKAFRECHTTLHDLTKSLSSVPQSDTIGFVRITVQRLDDFNEDTRVELEIRSADEERTTQAFQTLLCVKGAITSEAEMGEVEQRITAFVEGTDKSVSRAKRQFSQKLDDLTHDISSIKAFIHDLTQNAPEPPKSSGTWSTFTASLLRQRPPSRPVSPAPTFGSVMTTPRLRHAPSLPQMRESPALESFDPLAGLHLRIPIPSPIPAPSSPPVGRPPSRQQRPTSGMHMLGFGPRGGLLGSPNASRRTSLAQVPVLEKTAEATNTYTFTDASDDIE